MTLQDYIVLFSNYLNKNNDISEPKSLYEPMQYILDLGGKRIRPVLALISAEGFGGKVQDALSAAMAVEVFHNFTLLHDDIMDHAQLRRGKPTVHKKWNVNTAILSGDVMVIKAYHYLENYEPNTFKSLTQLLTKTAIEVCEGQQYDMDFEIQKEVTLPHYMEMIRLKTAVLLGASMQMGAIVAKASQENQQKIYDFGQQIGLAFQLQDDFLDTFGKVETFGKQIGGDIIENKKTWLYLKTLELADEQDTLELKRLYTTNLTEPSKIEQVKSFFIKHNTHELIQNEIDTYSHNALQILDLLDFDDVQKNVLESLVNQLKKRDN
jgi:geranylgeranyl diphosphate synthase type II